MREGWTYKKLGEACDLYQPKTISSDMLVSDGEYPVYGANGIIGRYNQYNHEASEVLVTCRGATCGTINVSTPFSWINGNAMVVHPKSDDLNKTYLAYAIQGIDMSDVITGAAQPQITRQSLSPKKLPIPPLAEQERIVSELDLLSSIIEKKKAQLKEYDQLAQSIFYDMFGEPIENSKGWGYIKLKALIEENVILYHLDGNHGGDYPRSEEFVNKGVPYIGANCISDGFVDFSLAKYLPKDRAYRLRKGLAKNEDVLFAHNASVGPVAYLITDEELVILSTSLTAFRCNQEKMNPLFLRAYMQSTWFESQYKLTMKQTTRNQVPITQQKNMDFILPPLTLQQSFAEKIEAIEKQKSLVQQSIVETQTMFDYTMDKYFG